MDAGLTNVVSLAPLAPEAAPVQEGRPQGFAGLLAGLFATVVPTVPGAEPLAVATSGSVSGPAVGTLVGVRARDTWTANAGAGAQAVGAALPEVAPLAENAITSARLLADAREPGVLDPPASVDIECRPAGDVTAANPKRPLIEKRARDASMPEAAEDAAPAGPIIVSVLQPAPLSAPPANSPDVISEDASDVAIHHAGNVQRQSALHVTASALDVLPSVASRAKPPLGVQPAALPASAMARVSSDSPLSSPGIAAGDRIGPVPQQLQVTGTPEPVDPAAILPGVSGVAPVTRPTLRMGVEARPALPELPVGEGMAAPVRDAPPQLHVLELSGIAVVVPVVMASRAEALVPAPAVLDRSAGGQVATAVRFMVRNREGPQALTLRLDPEELGRVEITIFTVRTGGAAIAMTAERPETLLLLMRDQVQLHRALDGAGIAVEGRQVSFQLAAQADAGSGSGQGQLQGGAGQNGSGQGSQNDGRQHSPQSAAAFVPGSGDGEAGRERPSVAAPVGVGVDITA
jgi:flagellar hook-length control protein FliK